MLYVSLRYCLSAFVIHGKLSSLFQEQYLLARVKSDVAPSGSLKALNGVVRLDSCMLKVNRLSPPTILPHPLAFHAFWYTPAYLWHICLTCSLHTSLPVLEHSCMVIRLKMNPYMAIFHQVPLYGGVIGRNVVGTMLTGNHESLNLCLKQRDTEWIAWRDKSSSGIGLCSLRFSQSGNFEHSHQYLKSCDRPCDNGGLPNLEVSRSSYGLMTSPTEYIE